MAIERIILPSTGLYQRKVRHVVLKSDEPESLNDLVSLLQEDSSSPRLDDPLFLSHLEAEATGFLKEYAASDIGGFTAKVGGYATSDELEFVVSRQIERAWQDLDLEFQRHLSEEKKRNAIRRLIRVERAWDACEVLDLISVIRSQVEYGSNQVKYDRVEQVFSHTFDLGRAYERFKIRESEVKAWTGAKIFRGTSKGGIAAKAAAARQYPLIVAKFRASGMSQRRYSKQTGIPRSNLQRALKLVDSRLSK